MAPTKLIKSREEFVQSFLSYAKSYREENPGVLEKLMTINELSL